MDKKVVAVVALVAVGAGAFYLTQSGPEGILSSGEKQSESTEAMLTGDDDDGEGSEQGISLPPGLAEQQLGEEIKPAVKVYGSASEALEAIKKAASSFDDLVIEQFREPGADCRWCGELYGQLKDVLMDPTTNKDDVPFYAEILAISGKVENLKILTELAQGTQDPDLQEAFAQALELATGGDAVVPFLTEQLSGSNDRLREASVAALTNQGTRLAAESIYNHTVAKGDADGYYGVGIGLGEFVPDQESMPYLQGLAAKQDQYSHLAVKSMLNAGLPGLRQVFDTLLSAKDPEAARASLKDALEHVLIDNETEDFVKQMIVSQNNPVVVEFGNSILQRFAPEAPAEEGAE